jgi:probable HAF family extracellular repeat protein
MTMKTTPAIAFVLLAAGLAQAQARFQGVGDLPAGATYSEGNAVSADGRTAAGGTIIAGGGPFGATMMAYRWTTQNLIQPGFDLNGVSSNAYGISPDGSMIVGSADFGAFSPSGMQAFFNSPTTGTVLLGDLPGGVSGVPHSVARGISADGSTIIGLAQSDRGDEGFRYDVATAEMNAIGSFFPSPYGTYAYGVSGDGHVIVGSSYSAANELQAFRWTVQSDFVGLGFLPTPAGVTRYSQAEAISADGAVIVGESRSMNSPQGEEAFVWTASGGMVALGDLPGGTFQSWAYAVNADGSVVVGRATIDGPIGPFGGGSQGRAFIWDALHGMRDLQQVLIDAGANLTGWSLTEAHGVSADGRTIVGTGTDPQNFIEGWVATLPEPPCYANCDQSTAPPILNVSDFICFQSSFAAGSAYANCDGSTSQPVLTVNDFVCFMSRFAAGCD